MTACTAQAAASQPSLTGWPGVPTMPRIEEIAVSDPLFNWEQLFPEDATKLGQYLQEIGHRPVCRLDIRITSLEELKKAAVLVGELNKTLQVLAYADDRHEALRVILARGAMQQARIGLKFLRTKKFLAEQKKGTTRSAPWPLQVGDLDRPWKGPKAD
jgi:hypothetical protein